MDASPIINSNLLLSVVIPTYHRNDSLRAILEALTPGKQTLSADEYEVIVSDAGIRGNAEEMVRRDFPWAKWVDAKGCNPGRNRNLGARNAQGVWLVFLDDDCRVESGYLQGYASLARGSDYDVLEGKITCFEKANRAFRRQPENLGGGHFTTGNIAIRREVFFRIGPFDEDLRMAEDMELGHRLQMTGQRIRFCPEAVVDHPSQIVGWRYMLKQNWERHWYILYRHKIGIATPLHESAARAVWLLLIDEVVYLMRIVVHLYRRHDPKYWRAQWFGHVLWLVLFAPLAIPHTLWSEIRYRKLIREGVIQIRPFPAADHQVKANE